MSLPTLRLDRKPVCCGILVNFPCFKRKVIFFRKCTGDRMRDISQSSTSVVLSYKVNRDVPRLSQGEKTRTSELRVTHQIYPEVLELRPKSLNQRRRHKEGEETREVLFHEYKGNPWLGVSNGRFTDWYLTHLLTVSYYYWNQS